MAHFAELNENNVVLQVIVVNNDALNPNDEETSGVEFLTSLYGHSNWKQTSYSNRIRKNFAAIGYVYDPVADHFHAPQPFPSWTLDENAIWQAPVAAPVNPYTPDQEQFWLEPEYQWDEATLNWIVVPTE